MGDDMSLGLALGGGGAFGAAHLGVLQVLAERGLRCTAFETAFGAGETDGGFFGA